MKSPKMDSFTRDIVSKLSTRKARMSPDMKALMSGKLSIADREKLMEKLEITKPELDALKARRKVSTTEILEVLRIADVPEVVIDYIAARLAKKHYVDIAKRSNDKLVAFTAVATELSEAELENEPIPLATAIDRAAETTGIPRTTLRTHLKQSIRKK